MVVNQKKSQLMPTQKVDHLGFTVDFQHGTLQVPQEKLKAMMKELGKLLTHSEISCRKMAAILGATRSFLMAMPFLRAFTVQFARNFGLGSQGADPFRVKKAGQGNALPHGGMERQKIPRQNPSKGTSFGFLPNSMGRSRCNQWVHNPRLLEGKKILHIIVKELEAAINTVKSLAKPKEHVCLKVDNAATFYYLTKHGGRIQSLNQMVRPFLQWCMEKKVTLDVQLVKRSQDLADGPSRWGRTGGTTH